MYLLLYTWIHLWQQKKPEIKSPSEPKMVANKSVTFCLQPKLKFRLLRQSGPAVSATMISRFLQQKLTESMKVLSGWFSESLTAFWATTNSEPRSQCLYVASEALGTENLASMSHYWPGGISSFPTLRISVKIGRAAQ